MKKRSLGNTGLEVSELAFGGVEIGMPYGVGVGSAAEMPSETTALHLLQASLDAGINFFDTAREYGRSEALMGKAFYAKRDQVVLATKCKHLPAAKEASFSNRKAFIEASLEESLRALQTDHVDIFMLHDSNPLILQDAEIAGIFSGLKKSGKLRATGVSTYTPEETLTAIGSGNWDVIQLPFNLMDQRQEAAFSLATQKGIGIVVRSVLLKGLLSHRGKNLHPALQKVEKHIGLFEEQARRSQTDLPTLATKFALSFKEVSAILVGLDKTEYLQKSVGAADDHYFGAEDLKRLQSLAYPEPAFLNLHQWNVEGWLK